MKKVRKRDLEDLIINFYCEFIAHVSESEYVDLSYDEKVKVNVKSTHIEACWNFDDSDSQIDMENFLNEFKKEIEKITFENLKVTYASFEKNQYMTMIKIYIANAYEVIE